jgi:hypothetical protein
VDLLLGNAAIGGTGLLSDITFPSKLHSSVGGNALPSESLAIYGIYVNGAFDGVKLDVY